MMEVLKALQELNVSWKKIGHYNMKCRWMPGFYPGYGDESDIIGNDDAAASASYVVKFEVQVLIPYSLIVTTLRTSNF